MQIVLYEIRLEDEMTWSADVFLSYQTLLIISMGIMRTRIVT
jgi:hypothetical protein